MRGFGAYLANWNVAFANSSAGTDASAECDTSADCDTSAKLSTLVWTFTHLHIRACRLWVSEYTEKSRFVLYDNGAFALQYPALGGHIYRGSYTEENGVLYFKFEGDVQWSATGKLEGDSLKVQSNTMMQMDDFENAVYARTP